MKNVEKPRFIRVCLFDSPEGAAYWKGFAAQMTGDTMFGKLFILKTEYEDKNSAISVGDVIMAAEWEWDGGTDLIGHEKDEAILIFLNKILEKEKNENTSI